MYSFINDISIVPAGYNSPDAWSLLSTVMNISSELRAFNLERIRVPSDFLDRPIGNHQSIRYYLDCVELEWEEKVILLEFLQNRLEEMDATIEAALSKVQQNKLVEVSLNGVPSNLLTEASIMKCPLISFKTDATFHVDVLDCSLLTLTENDKQIERLIRIKNIFSENGIKIHYDFLVEWKHKISFANLKWDPIAQPIWNESTAETLEELNFPESVKQQATKYEELERVGIVITEMNGWQFDEMVTKKNKNSGQYRRIFQSRFGTRTAYLSIDFEDPYGGFEVHNHKGRHQGQINFTGKYVKKADPTDHHDIKV